MISVQQLRATNHWLNFFHDILTSNIPQRLHVRALDDAGNPQMSPAFAHWLDGTGGRSEADQDRVRLQRAMKRLRERSLREWEVLHRYLVMAQTTPEVTDWLNERAIRGGHPERYTPDTTLVILYAAVDKVCDWY